MSDAEPRVKIEEGVVYGVGGGRELRCDVYRPIDAVGLLPGLLLVHGGGWRRGSRAGQRGYGLRIAREGFVCVAIEYRLLGESPWPAAIHDVKAALRFVRARAGEHGIDPEQICIQGSSAGAHLALLAAGTPGRPRLEGDGGHAGVPTQVRAAVGIYPPTTFYVSGERASGALPGFVLLGGEATVEAAHEASPRSHVTPSYPPTFLIHGSADKVVPPSSSLRMYEALAEAGVPVELKMFANLPHGFASHPDYQRLLSREILSFLRRSLAAPRNAAV